MTSAFLSIFPRVMIEEGAENNKDRYKPRFLRSFVLIHGPVKMEDIFEEEIDYDDLYDAYDEFAWEYLFDFREEI